MNARAERQAKGNRRQRKQDANKVERERRIKAAGKRSSTIKSKPAKAKKA
jgi:hypothetical protein